MADRIFTLEALNAKHGDSLLLHYGTTSNPKHILIDGGTKGVYRRQIKPRLEEIAANTAADDAKVVLEYVMLTHIDDDHIMGLLDLVDDLKFDKAPCTPSTFMCNAFEDAKKLLAPEFIVPHVQSALASTSSLSHEVLASVGQGRSLRDGVRGLGLRTNLGDGKLLVADDKAFVIVDHDGIKITLVGPSETRIAQLLADWKEKTKNVAPASPESAALLASYADKSVYNLSSLILVVETKGADARRMLLTGDARGDDIIAGLEMGGFLSGGKAHFDILKMPHHGSNRNMTKKFLEDITAAHYVISADGRHGNPDGETLDWFVSIADSHPFVVTLTNGANPDFPELEQNVQSLIEKLGTSRVRVRATDDKSVKVELLKPINF